MKIAKYFVVSFLFVGLLATVFSTVYAATPTVQTINGGTGSTTLSGILVGNGTSAVRTATLSGCTLSGAALTCTGTGGGTYSFTPANGYVSTSTVFAFLQGLISNGSTTVSGLSSGLVGNNNGLLYGFASSSLFGYIPLNPTRNINTTYPILGGGNLSADRTLSLDFSTTTANTWSLLQTLTGGFAIAATSTGTFGINLTGGCYALNSTCLTAGALGGGASEAVNWATNAVLAGTPTYANGSAGVGATLTELGTGALSVDSNAPAAGDRVLVKDQASGFQNGIYVVTATGSGIASYILTRVSDYNTPTEITPGMTTYVISGTANTDTTWAVSYTPPLVIGTNNLVYTEASISNAVPNTRTITVAGTANQLTSSAGAQDLSANRTWTLSFPTLIVNPNASTTLFSNFTKAFFGATATTTIDSTGNVVIPSGSGLTITGKSDGCGTFATGVLNSTGTPCGSGGGTFSFTPTSNFGQTANATTTALWMQGSPFALFASSTSVFQNASTTQLTLGTKLFDSTGAAGTPGQVLGLLNGQPAWVATSSVAGVSGRTTTASWPIPFSDCSPEATSTRFAVGGSFFAPMAVTNAVSFTPMAMTFGYATSSAMNCIVHLPTDYSSGLTFNAIYTSTTTAAGIVPLDLEATSTANGQQYGNPSVFSQIWPASTTAADRIKLPTTAGVGTSTAISLTSIANLAAGNDLLIRLTRWGANAADTMGGDLYLPKMWLTYTSQ